MVGAIANSAVSARRLVPAAALAASLAAGLASQEAGPGGDATDPGETGLLAAGAPGREGTAAGKTPCLTGTPGTRPPVHMRVLAGEAGLLAPRPPPAGAAVTIALPQAWQRVTDCIDPGLAAGSGAWQ